MAYDLQEEEQLEALKAWWKQYGNLVVTVVTVSALALASFQGWRYYQHSQATEAAALHEQLEDARQAGDHGRTRGIADRIMERYRSTPYATLAALASARASFDSGERDDAKARLRWVIERAREEEAKDVARLRLAGILLDEKRYEEALQLVDRNPIEPMTGLYADMRGDILLALGKTVEARKAYELAYHQSEAGSRYRAVVELKLDALGGTP
jgi:predicted negative regulator of RcsB-dependent stress response